MLENWDSACKERLKNDVKHDSHASMNNLIRSELLGQSMPFASETRSEGLTSGGAPLARRESGGTSLFKYRSSIGSIATAGSSSHHGGGGSLDSQLSAGGVSNSLSGGSSMGTNGSTGSASSMFGAVHSPDRTGGDRRSSLGR
jgi:hypothetical protein